MATFNLSRSASFYESGIGRGLGFRDSNQDLLGFVHMVPSRARERILDLSATQHPWIMIAETMVGNGNRAFDYYTRVNPSARENIGDLHRCEPYVYAQMIAGKDAPTHGEAKNSWLTGTAAWNYFTITQWILGIRTDFDGLLVDPVIRAQWKGFTVKRKFRGNTYVIEVKNPHGQQRGVRKLLVDGKEIPGNVLPARAPQAEPIGVVAVLERQNQTFTAAA